MAVTRKTAADYAIDLESSILARSTSYDTKVGPIVDLYIQPTANVLELQNERIRKVQQLLSLINDGSFTDDDLDQFVYNESLIRLDGAKATATLIFSRSTQPTSDITVKANFPIATLPDEETGSAITFMTVADTTMLVANASAYFNSTTQRYELQVLAEAVSGSESGNVGPNRIVRALRPLNGFDSVFNRDASTGGRDRETNSQLIQRYMLALMGTSPTVVSGIEKVIRDQYSNVIDSNVVYGNNTMNVRSADDGGAVDVYIIGSAPTSVTETVVFTGAEQSITLAKQPVVSITSAGSYVQGVDFELVKDTSGYAGSTRASDGIKWLSTGTSPSVGAVVVVTYTYNGLPSELQNGFASADYDTPGRDILFKEADQVDVTITASLKVRAGFGVQTVLSAVTTSIQNAINSLQLGNNVEGSDIQAVVRAFTGVDNFIITNLSRVGETGTADITIGPNEYARISADSISISLI